MKQLLFILLLNLSLFAKTMTPSDVYYQVMLIEHEVHFLLNYYGLAHDHDAIKESTEIKTNLKPRHSWQKSYELLVKINILRELNNLSRIEPVGIEPVLDLHPDMVYEQTLRILTEIQIFKLRKNIKNSAMKPEIYKNKTPSDVYSALSDLSKNFDSINNTELKSSYVYAETMRIYDDLDIVLQHLNIEDYTGPSKKESNSKHSDTFKTAVEILDKIKEIQSTVGIETIDFSPLFQNNSTSSDVFSMTQLIISELQTIKAYIGLKHYVTTPATIYKDKTSSEVNQLMNWNLRKVSLIKTMGRK